MFTMVNRTCPVLDQPPMNPVGVGMKNGECRGLLGVPESMLQPGGALDVLRMKLAQEPSIRGNN